jgi:hypothetical protein
MIAHTPAQAALAAAHSRPGAGLCHRAPHRAAADARGLQSAASCPPPHAEIAEEKSGLAGAYELSIVNVDKPFLDYTEIDQRLKQFDRPVWVTRLPTFLEKARHFHGACFAVGIDTLIRIAEPGYYGGPEARDRRSPSWPGSAPGSWYSGASWTTASSACRTWTCRWNCVTSASR